MARGRSLVGPDLVSRVPSMVVIAAQSLRLLLTEIFSSAGCSAAESERIGRYLVSANLAGHDSHGVVRTQRYVEWLRAGVQYADRDITIVTESDAFAVVDGGYGMGQTVGP